LITNARRGVLILFSRLMRCEWVCWIEAERNGPGREKGFA
jgi:hypothetical protein